MYSIIENAPLAEQMPSCAVAVVMVIFAGTFAAVFFSTLMRYVLNKK